MVEHASIVVPWTLAQEAGEGYVPGLQGEGAGALPPGNQPGPPPSMFGGSFIFILLGLMVFMLVMTAMQGRKEKRRVAEMLSSLKKGDRVQMIGGMQGVIHEIKDDFVLLRVDEHTNTRIRFARSAVQTVLKESRDRSSNGAEHTSEEEAEAASV
ncbi:MAG: preprotein translocase subunit YajC [Phycisphaerales bacterium]|nr:preprotein translocase subunit YajC [Phycisphaerales bacterium]